jgi:AraC family transcriptional regulator
MRFSEGIKLKRTRRPLYLSCVKIHGGGALSRETVQINPTCYPKCLNTIVSSPRFSVAAHEHCLPASLKFVISGVVDIETARAKYRINRERFVLINAWETYSFSVPAGRTAQTFSLFFRPYLLSEIAEIARSTEEELLDYGSQRREPYLELPEAVMSSESCAIGTKMRCLFQSWQQGASQLCLTDEMRLIAETVVNIRETTNRQLKKINAKKKSTRDELFRRSQRAYLFIRENFCRDIELDTIAREIGMAPHHLHRTFSAVFGRSPHQAIAYLRLREARRLISSTDLPIAAISRHVGYSSAPSFTNLFRATFGVPPSALRPRSHMK